IPAVDYLMKDEKVQRWVLAGTDYVYPRTTNKILEAYLKSKGEAQEDIMINYTPFGHSDWQTIVADIKKFGSAGKKTAVVSTINGDANVPFYKELGNQGAKAKDILVVAYSVLEDAAEPPHHQAGVHRRGEGRWPVQRGVEDAGSRPGRRLVEGARRLQGPDRRLGREEVRQLQHQDQQVRWRLTQAWVN